MVSAFSLVETGKSQYVAADAVIGSYAALVQSVDVQPIALLGSKGGYCIGVDSSNQELQKAISAALTAVSVYLASVSLRPFILSSPARTEPN